jgi:hypothetical protein
LYLAGKSKEKHVYEQAVSEEFIDGGHLHSIAQKPCWGDILKTKADLCAFRLGGRYLFTYLEVENAKFTHKMHSEYYMLQNVL